MSDVTFTTKERDLLDQFGIGNILDDGFVSPDEILKLKALQKAFPVLRKRVNEAARAGFDTDEMLRTISEVESDVERLLKVYG